MKLVPRVALAILALLLLVFLLAALAVLAPIPALGGLLAAFMESHSWFRICLCAAVLFCIVSLAAILVFVLLYPSNRNFFVIQGEKGRLRVSLQSISSLAAVKLRAHPAVKRYAILPKAGASKTQLRLHIKVETDSSVDFAGLGSELQADIERALQEALSATPQQIDVDIFPYEGPADPSAPARKQSRVE